MATNAVNQKPTEIKSVKAEIADKEILQILNEKPAEQTAASTENLNEKVTEIKADTKHFKEVLLDSTKFKSTYQKIGKYYCCKLCINSQKFPQFFALQQHLKFQHFITNSTLNETETESDEEVPTNDNITASDINYAEAVKKIAAKHYECTMCSESKSFASNQGVQRHIREQHYGQDSYQCTLCDISTEYKSSQALQIHIKIQHNGYRYVCSFCDTSYKSKTAIYSHLKRSHKTADHADDADDVGDPSAYRFEIPKTCKPAEQFYLNYAEFIKQAEDSSYQCALCPENTKKYTTMQAVRIHIKILHFGIRLQCSECSCKFRSKQSIIKHLKATHNIIKRASDIFQIEMPTNKKIEELRANCAAAEEDAANLIRKKEARRDHTRRQNLDMLKTTEVCPSLRLNYMKSIRKVDDHYECVHCEVSRKYNCRSGLRVHIKISHYGYRYVCNECDVNYKTKLIILRHLKKTHNINGNAFKMEIPKKSGKTKSNNSNYAETEDSLLEKLHEEQKAKFLRHDDAAIENNTLLGLIKTEQISDEINAELDKASSTSASYQQRLNYSSASPESRALLKLQQVKNHPRQRFAQAVQKSSSSKKLQHQQHFQANALISLESKNSSKHQHQQPYQSKRSQRLYYEAATSKSLSALQLHEKEENSSFQSKFIKQEEISFGEYSMSYASKSKLRYRSSKIIFKYSTSYKKIGKSYRCKLCAKSQRRFFQFSAIRQHIKFQHFTIRFQCTQCSEQLAHPALLRKHYTQQHATNGPFKLKINLLKKPRNLTNPKKTNNAAKQNVKINYKNLIKQIDTGRYECRLCPKSISYTTPHGICNHIRNQHYGYKHACQKCNVHFITKEALQKHLRQMHFKLIKKSGEFFECGKCWTPKKYKNINTLQNHIQTEHYGYRYVCGECSSQCMSKTALQRHLKQAHGMQVKSAELKCELPENKNPTDHGDNKEELTINSSAAAENSINAVSQFFEHSQQLEFTNKFIKQEQIDLSEYSLSYDNVVAASASFVTPKTEHSSSSTSFVGKFLDEASLQQPEQHVSNSSFQFAGSIRQQLELSHDVIKQEHIEFKEYSLSNPKLILITSKAEPGLSTLTSCRHQLGSNPEASLKLLGQQMEFTPESIKQEENSFSEYFLSCNTSGEAKPNQILIGTKAEHISKSMTTGHQLEQAASTTQGSIASLKLADQQLEFSTDVIKKQEINFKD